MRTALTIVSVIVALIVALNLLGAAAPAPGGPTLSSYSTGADGLAAWSQLLTRSGHRVQVLRTTIAASHLPPRATLIVADVDRLSDAPGTAAKLTALRRSGGRVLKLGARGARPFTNARLAHGDNAVQALREAGPASATVIFDEYIHGYRDRTGLAAIPVRWWLCFGLAVAAALCWAAWRGVRLGGADPVPTAPQSARSEYIDAMAELLARSRA